MSSKAKSNVKPIVAKYPLFFPKNRVCEFRVKAMCASKSVCARFNKLDGDSLIGIGRPLVK
jgi:hypothetical protein